MPAGLTFIRSPMLVQKRVQMPAVKRKTRRVSSISAGSFLSRKPRKVTGATLRGRAAAARARARKVLRAQEAATCQDSRDTNPGPAEAIRPPE